MTQDQTIRVLLAGAMIGWAVMEFLDVYAQLIREEQK